MILIGLDYILFLLFFDNVFKKFMYLVFFVCLLNVLNLFFFVFLVNNMMYIFLWGFEVCLYISIELREDEFDLFLLLFFNYFFFVSMGFYYY